MRDGIVFVSEKVMPYRCDFYRAVSNLSERPVEVVFLDSWGYDKRYDPTFDATYRWKPDVLEGFEVVMPRSLRLVKTTYTGDDKTPREYRLAGLGAFLKYVRTFLGYVNPSAIGYLWKNSRRFAVIESYMSINALLAAVVLKLAGSKVFLRGEMSERWEKEPLSKRIVKTMYLKTVMSLFDGFFYSHARGRLLIGRYSDNKNVFFVPSSVSGDFVSKKPRAHIYREYGMDSNAFYVVGVGRLVPRKNWKDVLQAIEMACSQNDDIRLLLVGGGPEQPALEDYVLSRGLDSKVRITGFVPQECVKDYLRVAGCQVQASAYDPGPKAINEGIVNRVPIVISDRCGLANDACIHEFNALVYPHGDVRLLGEYLIRLAGDDELRAKLSSNHTEVLKTWSLENAAVRLVEALESFGEEESRSSRVGLLG